MLFVDAGFAGDLQDSKSTTGSFLVLVGPQTWAPISWMCKKQVPISHSSSEAEVIALEAALRLEGIPALLFWDEVIAMFSDLPKKKWVAPGRTANNGNTIHSFLANVDYVPPSLPMAQGLTKLILMEDNDAVIKMTIKGRSPNMRHVARVHRVDLHWLFERIRNHPGIEIRWVDTKHQIADIFTKGTFVASTWQSLCQ